MDRRFILLCGVFTLIGVRGDTLDNRQIKMTNFFDLQNLVRFASPCQPLTWQALRNPKEGAD